MTREEAAHVIETSDLFWLRPTDDEYMALSMAIDVLKRKAEWEPHPDPDNPEWDVCSRCGVGCKRREFGEADGRKWMTEYSYQYCPNCGAYMGE